MNFCSYRKKNNTSICHVGNTHVAVIAKKISDTEIAFRWHLKDSLVLHDLYTAAVLVSPSVRYDEGKLLCLLEA